MMGSKKKNWAAAAVLCVALAGCTSMPDYDYDGRYAGGPARPAPPPIRNGGLQCVPYARDHSNVKLQGDAYTWWAKAEGRYAKNPVPSEGSVMVLFNYAGPNRGHVAVVRDVISNREIRVDHANWLDDGAIYTDNAVADVSPGNDWSLVRVFNQRTGAWGSRLYPVQGFIGPGRDDGRPRYNPDRDVLASVSYSPKPATARRTAVESFDRGTLTDADMAIEAPSTGSGGGSPKRDAIAALLDAQDDAAN